MTTPDTSTTSAEPITEPTTEIESRGQTPRNFIAEALHSQTEALEIADIENRLERIIRERGIETPLTKPKNARRAAQSTSDAVLWVLREYGVARLYDPWVTNRLAQFSLEQIAELVAALKRLKTKPLGRNVTDELIGGIAKLRGNP